MEGAQDEETTIETNDAGQAVFTVAPGVYSYEVEKDDYKEIENSVSVTGDTTISLVLVQEKHDKKEHNGEVHNENEHIQEHIRQQLHSIPHE